MICKYFYLKTVLDECLNNSLSYECIESSVSDICKTQEDYLVEMKINSDQLEKILPHIFLFPRFH